MYRVRLLPSGHSFTLQATDSLLEGALRAGLAPNYGCSNGNCGLCKARVVSGTTTKIRHHDYVISAAEKALGYVLMCSVSPTSDLELEAGEAHAANEIPAQHIVARVRVLTPLAGHVGLLHLQTPRTQRLRFLAGQSVALGIGAARATLPIASCPCDDRNLQFHVVAGNDTAARAIATLRPGDAVTVDGPTGDFTLAESDRPVVFVAGDTGFAPIKSLAEHLMAVDETRPATLYWLAAAGGHYMDNLCRSWTDALDAFRYCPITIGTDGYAPALADIARDIAGDAPVELYVAGPEALLSAARERLAPVTGARLRLALVANKA